jgi:hypothetical protein
MSVQKKEDPVRAAAQAVSDYAEHRHDNFYDVAPQHMEALRKALAEAAKKKAKKNEEV